MRVGPTTEALASGLAWGVRMDIKRGGRVLFTDVPVTDVVLEWTAGRAVPAQLTFKAPLDWVPEGPLDAFARFGQRACPTVLCEDRQGYRWETPLGEYVIDKWDVSDKELSVTAVDLMQLLEDDPMAWPSSPPKSATVSSELQRLAGQVPVTLDDGVVDSAVNSTAQWGNSRTESVLKLAESRSFGLRTGVDGVIHAYPLKDAKAVQTVYESLDLPGRGGNGLLVEAPLNQGPDKRRPNRWIVTGSHTEGEKEQKWTATRTDTGFPYEPAAYGWVTSHNEFSAAERKQQVEESADTYMRKDVYAVRSRSIEIVTDPRIEVGDVIGFATRDERVIGRVTAFVMPVSDHTESMRVDVDVLEW